MLFRGFWQVMFGVFCASRTKKIFQICSKIDLLCFVTHFMNKISLNKYTLTNIAKLHSLGKGGYAEVFQGQHTGSGQLVALKECEIDNYEGISHSILREIFAMRSLSHPSILKLYNVDFFDETAHLILPYCSSDLHKLLKQRRLKPCEIRSIMRQLLQGVQYMHEKQVIHRDLKPQNILIEFESQSEIIVKIADFGLSRSICTQTANDYHYSLEVCTVWYRPPEILLGGAYTFAADLWSLGCMMAEMFFGQPLFPGKCDVNEVFLIFNALGTPSETNWRAGTHMENFDANVFPKWSKQPMHKILQSAKVPPTREALHLLRYLLEMNPKKRFTATQALNHVYFTE